MNRTIKFRGKRTDNGEWIFGDLYHTNELTCICDWSIRPHTVENFAVDAETVGQFTGLLDKNGKEIYEGDKLLIRGRATAVVIWRNEGFDILDTCSWTQTNKGEINGFVYVPETKIMEVIGNIHYNPELLNKK